MDNALIAAALTKQGRTAGENIANVAQGVLGVNQYRRGLVAQQAEVPLEFAKQVGSLQAQDAMLQMYKGMGDYYSARGTAALATPQDRLEAAMARTQMEGAQHPRIGTGPDGKPVVEQYQIDPNDKNFQGKWVAHPELSVNDLRRQEHSQNPAGGVEFQSYEGVAGPMPDPTTDPKGSVKWWTGFRQAHGQYAGAGAVNAAGFRNTLPPSTADEANKWTQDIGAEAQKLMQIQGKKFDETSFISDTQAKLMKTIDPKTNKTYGISDAYQLAKMAAPKAAQAAQEHDQQIAQAHSDFGSLTYQQQKAYGNFQGYLIQEKGYDKATGTFAQKPSTDAQQNLQNHTTPGPVPKVATGPGAAPQNATAPNPMGMGNPSSGAQAPDPMNILRFLPTTQ
jgi:hypothetical protein